VIARLRSPLDDHNGSVRVVGGLGDDLEEQRFGDVVGAGARDKVSARAKDFEGAEIDFLVAALGCRDAFAVFGEGRGIENDHVEAPVFFIVLLEHVERIGLAERHVFDRVKCLISSSSGDGRS